MSARGSNTTMQSAFVVAMLSASAIAISLQFLYTAGQVYHIATMAYKAGGFMPHLVSFGRFGVFLYLIVAVAVAIGLWAFIRHQGGARNAKTAALLLMFSLVSTIAFAGLVVMPYSDIVSRS